MTTRLSVGVICHRHLPLTAYGETIMADDYSDMAAMGAFEPTLLLILYSTTLSFFPMCICYLVTLFAFCPRRYCTCLQGRHPLWMSSTCIWGRKQSAAGVTLPPCAGQDAHPRIRYDAGLYLINRHCDPDLTDTLVRFRCNVPSVRKCPARNKHPVEMTSFMNDLP